MNNKDTRTASFIHYFEVFIADFEQVHTEWEAFATSYKNFL